MERLGDEAGKVLWKIYNQDISSILKETLNSSVGFYLDFFHLSFSLESSSLTLLFNHKEGADMYLFSFPNLFS